ncbi:MAG: hypothetical protein KQH63_17875 [Desulfobulbaceae bacterium]|nr:hypothetical protein [Desulfobulbaceae bacterium]
MKNKFFWIRNSPIQGSNILFCLFILVFCSCDNSSNTSITKNCEPTSFDEIGPFYRPNAPIRDKVGTGYLLKGRVLSTNKCAPLPKAKLEFWLVNSNGEYDDAHRATVIADNNGKYSFESNRPTNYASRLPHIHMRITAQGHEELITQHYPKGGDVSFEFDIVLLPVSRE